jgi:hypothetical protein
MENRLSLELKAIWNKALTISSCENYVHNKSPAFIMHFFCCIRIFGKMIRLVVTDIEYCLESPVVHDSEEFLEKLVVLL